MKKIFRNVTVFLLAACTVLAVTGCGDGADDSDDNSASAAEPGKIIGKVLSNDGDMMNAGIIVVDGNNNSRLATTNAYGGYTLYLAPGEYEITYTKGIEFSTYTTSVRVESLKTYYRPDVRLNRLVDPYSNGWVAGDAHQHSLYSDGKDTIENIVLGNAAAGLYWGYITDHNVSRGVPEYRNASGVTVYTDSEGNRRSYNGFGGVEVTTEFGHIQCLGSAIMFDRYEIGFTEGERGSSEAARRAAAREKLVYVAEQIVRQGGIPQINHPYSTTTMGVRNFIAEDDYDFYDLFATMEIWNGYFIVPDGRFTDRTTDNQNYTAKILWYSLLNQVKEGHKFIAATGGTDIHDVTGAASGANRDRIVQNPQTVGDYFYLCRYSGQYNGVPADYVRIEGEITEEKILDSLRNGRNFISNGPILDCSVNGKIYGETAEAVDGSVTFTNHIFNRDGIEQIRIVKNGEIVKTVDADGATEFTDDISVDVQRDDWVLIEALGPWGSYAISNPVFIG